MPMPNAGRTKPNRRSRRPTRASRAPSSIHQTDGVRPTDRRDHRRSSRDHRAATACRGADARRWQVEALVANLDIGFVKPGQSVAVKVDAFPFTRFGVLHGKSHSLSPPKPSKSRKPSVGSPMQQLLPTPPPPVSQAGQPQSFVFPVTIALDEQVMNISGEMIPLTSGMTVSVEIKTDSRRVIDYLLSPLAKVTSEAFKER
ncbi:hypothetical protein ACVOMV_37085 [Mesorhizobium atlanticum]